MWEICVNTVNWDNQWTIYNKNGFEPNEGLARKSISQITLRNCSAEALFLVQFYTLLEQRTLNKSALHFFKIILKKKKKKKNRPARMQWVGMTLVPGKGGLSSKKDLCWHARKRGI